MGLAYYNEIDPYAAQWLRNLIAAGHIAPGEVDERSIVDVRPDDLAGYTQCHFFAGIGGWSYAARLAGWPDDRALWTGSCPCQPFSVAGKGGGRNDERHLWPEFHRLIRARRPAVVMGEQVAAAVGKHWLDGVHSDLEGIGYAVGATVVPACAVDAPHRRDRLWFVADAGGGRCGEPVERQGQQPRRAEVERAGHGAVAHTNSVGSGQEYPDAGRCLDGSATGQIAGFDGADDGALGNAIGTRLEGQRGHGDYRDEPGRLAAHEAGSIAPASSVRRNSTAWSGAEWLAGADGKARRFEPGIRLLAYGVPARVGKLRAYGNAIVPQVAAEVIGAYLDAERIAA